ncbi:hypothetical protein EC973_000075 [Apophysomyces ossiformis]|uniref:Uncharacterized protein n=1 Tax=Apophysomyces ossiformis TaxID=679940 RepID=A0A8H7BZT3_9FUNG|nr:hypothetical protein EC973_000075 [Apophysomyces ossiformis]
MRFTLINITTAVCLAVASQAAPIRLQELSPRNSGQSATTVANDIHSDQFGADKETVVISAVRDSVLKRRSFTRRGEDDSDRDVEQKGYHDNSQEEGRHKEDKDKDCNKNNHENDDSGDKGEDSTDNDADISEDSEGPDDQDDEHPETEDHDEDRDDIDNNDKETPKDIEDDDAAANIEKDTSNEGDRFSDILKNDFEKRGDVGDGYGDHGVPKEEGHFEGSDDDINSTGEALIRGDDVLPVEDNGLKDADDSIPDKGGDSDTSKVDQDDDRSGPIESGFDGEGGYRCPPGFNFYDSLNIADPIDYDWSDAQESEADRIIQKTKWEKLNGFAIHTANRALCKLSGISKR